MDLALHRFVKTGAIRRLARGVYDFPKVHPVLGPLSPSADVVAQALAGRDRTRLQPPGAYAANPLGLAEQVPAKAVFLTDGPSRTVKIGTMTTQLRPTPPLNMAAAGRRSGLLIQALRELGKEYVTPAWVEHLKRTPPAAERKEFLKDLAPARVWMHPVFRELAGVEKGNAPSSNSLSASAGCTSNRRRSGGTSGALLRDDLRDRVVARNGQFFGSAWANYDLAKSGTFRLVPPDGRMASLRRDYQAMKDMYLSEPVGFEAVMEPLDELEKWINLSGG